MITKKKLTSVIAAGALLVSAFTPAAFADYNHTNHVATQSNKTSSDFSFQSHRLFAFLEGEEEVPGPGDQDGFGFTRVKVDSENGRVCVTGKVFNISTPTAAHIHHAVEGQAGPVVVPLPTPDSNGKMAGCVSVSTDLTEDIVDNPSEYYVNVHSSEYPDGAVRGQL